MADSATTTISQVQLWNVERRRVVLMREAAERERVRLSNGSRQERRMMNMLLAMYGPLEKRYDQVAKAFGWLPTESLEGFSAGPELVGIPGWCRVAVEFVLQREAQFRAETVAGPEVGLERIRRLWEWERSGLLRVVEKLEGARRA